MRIPADSGIIFLQEIPEDKLYVMADRLMDLQERNYFLIRVKK